MNERYFYIKYQIDINIIKFPPSSTKTRFSRIINSPYLTSTAQITKWPLSLHKIHWNIEAWGDSTMPLTACPVTNVARSCRDYAAIVKKIMDLHGAIINVDSQIRKGTIFSFQLPTVNI